MDVTIDERKVTLASEYDIETPNTKYHARQAILSFNDNLSLQDVAGAELAQIQGHFSPLHLRHDFNFSDGRTYEFHCQERWKKVFVCTGNQESFTLYEHADLRYSVFKNDQQIAAFFKNRIVFGNGNHYDLRLNADADLVLILCMVLTINSLEHDDHDESVSIDFGSLGPEARTFDESWEPR